MIKRNKILIIYDGYEVDVVKSIIQEIQEKFNHQDIIIQSASINNEYLNMDDINSEKIDFLEELYLCIIFSSDVEFVPETNKIINLVLFNSIFTLLVHFDKNKKHKLSINDYANQIIILDHNYSTNELILSIKSLIDKKNLNGLEKATVHFNLDGGNLRFENSIIIYKNSLPYKLPTPTKENYEFLGWFFESDSTIVSPSLTSLESFKTSTVYLKAKWSKKVSETIKIKKILSVRDVSLALSSCGKLYSWGDNRNGFLANGKKQFYMEDDDSIKMKMSNGQYINYFYKNCKPNEISSLFKEKIIDIGLSEDGPIYLTESKKLFAINKSIIFANSSAINRSIVFDYLPKEITKNLELKTGETIISISSSPYHLSVETNFGRFLIYGSVFYYTLHRQIEKYWWSNIPLNFSLSNRDNHIIISAKDAIIIHKNKEIRGYGKSRLLLNNNTNIDSENKTDVDLLLGFSKKNKLDYYTTNVKAFSCSRNLCILAGDRIFAWDEILNYVDITDEFKLIKGDYIISIKTENNICAVSNEGRVFVWKCYRTEWGISILEMKDITSYFENLLIKSQEIDEKVCEIFASNYTFFALTNLGNVFAWGSNNSGQIGDGTIEEKPFPVKINFK